MAEIEEALQSHLVGFAGLAALVGTRVFPAPAPQATARPYVTYQRISGARVRSLDGPSGLAHPRIQIDVWADTYAAVKAAATQVRLALDGYAGTVDGVVIKAVILNGDGDRYEDHPKRHRVSMDFTIWHQEES